MVMCITEYCINPITLLLSSSIGMCAVYEIYENNKMKIYNYKKSIFHLWMSFPIEFLITCISCIKCSTSFQFVLPNFSIWSCTQNKREIQLSKSNFIATFSNLTFNWKSLKLVQVQIMQITWHSTLIYYHYIRSWIYPPKRQNWILVCKVFNSIRI